MALDTSDFGVILAEGEARLLVVEGLAPADGPPIDDAVATPLMFGMTMDASLAAEGRMQTRFHLIVASEAFAVSDAFGRGVAFHTAIGIVVGGVARVQGAWRDAEVVLRIGVAENEEADEQQREGLQPARALGTRGRHGSFPSFARCATLAWAILESAGHWGSRVRVSHKTLALARSK